MAGRSGARTVGLALLLSGGGANAREAHEAAVTTEMVNESGARHGVHAQPMERKTYAPPGTP